MNSPLHRPILVVEDDAVIQWSIETALRGGGYTAIVTASSRSEARKAMGKARPRLAILDLKLARNTSIPLADELAAARVPILFLSAYSALFLPDRHRGRPFISKPCSPAELVRHVEVALAEPRYSIATQPGAERSLA